MRVTCRNLIAGLALLAGSAAAYGQGFEGQGSKYIQLGLGYNQHFSSYSDFNKAYNYNYFGFNFQMEFGIQQYIGLGFGVGAEVAVAGSHYYYGGAYAPGYVVPGSPYTHFGVPVYFIGNFHFLQLIADKTGKNFADKMDVYGGLSIGSGPVFRSVKSKYKGDTYYDSGVGALFFFGPHVGIRYFPSEKVGIYAEMGYGKSLVNGGVVFKL